MDSLLFIGLGAALVVFFGYVRRRMWSFVAQKPEDYADGTPQFDLRTHLNGSIICEGVIYGPLGRVTSRFVGEFEAKWQGNVGVMKEHFRYDTGSEQKREWNLRIGNDGRIQATAPDVVGTGTGAMLGSAVQLQYKIKLPEDSGGHVLDTVDWMYLAPNGSIVNRSQFRKFGIQVAELVATMRPREARDITPTQDAA
ncbi:MAG: DUF3833 domain-containing protein [Sedimentitalea sp.]